MPANSGVVTERTSPARGSRAGERDASGLIGGPAASVLVHPISCLYSKICSNLSQGRRAGQGRRHGPGPGRRLSVQQFPHHRDAAPTLAWPASTLMASVAMARCILATGTGPDEWGARQRTPRRQAGPRPGTQTVPPRTAASCQAASRARASTADSSANPSSRPFSRTSSPPASTTARNSAGGGGYVPEADGEHARRHVTGHFLALAVPPDELRPDVQPGRPDVRVRHAVLPEQRRKRAPDAVPHPRRRHPRCPAGIRRRRKSSGGRAAASADPVPVTVMVLGCFAPAMVKPRFLPAPRRSRAWVSWCQRSRRLPGRPAVRRSWPTPDCRSGAATSRRRGNTAAGTAGPGSRRTGCSAFPHGREAPRCDVSCSAGARQMTTFPRVKAPA